MAEVAMRFAAISITIGPVIAMHEAGPRAAASG
jgi:hypothetical protein